MKQVSKDRAWLIATALGAIAFLVWIAWMFIAKGDSRVTVVDAGGVKSEASLADFQPVDLHLKKDDWLFFSDDSHTYSAVGRVKWFTEGNREAAIDDIHGKHNTLSMDSLLNSGKWFTKRT